MLWVPRHVREARTPIPSQFISTSLLQLWKGNAEPKFAFRFLVQYVFSEIVIQSVGGIRCVDSVFLTFDDGKANAMTQGKQLQCSKFFPQAFSSNFVFYVESQDMLQGKETPGTYFTTPVNSQKRSTKFLQLLNTVLISSSEPLWCSWSSPQILKYGQDR